MLNNLERDLGRHLRLQRRLTGIAFPPSRAHPLDPDSWARPTGGLAITQGPQLRVDGEAEQESTEISPKRRLTLIMKRTNAVVDAKPTIRRVMWGRRFLASTVVVPPDVAEHLNMDALAVLAVIRNEARTTGKCTLPVARIAERANIGRAKARAAIRLAEGLGLIAIEDAPDRRRVIINRGVMSRC